MNALSAAATIAAKDVRAFLRDRTGLILGFLLPIALVTVFGFIMRYAFGGGDGMPKVELWVCDEDHSPVSEKFVKALRGVDMLRVLPRPGDTPPTAEALRQKLADGEAHHAVVIPKGYGAQIEQKSLPRLQLYRDPGRAMEDKIVGVGLTQAFLSSSEGRMWSASMGDLMRRGGMPESEAERIMSAGREMENLIADYVEREKPAENPSDEPAPAQPESAAPAPEDAKKTSADGGPIGMDFFTEMAPVDRHDVQPPARPKMLSYQLAQSVSGMTVMMLMFGLTAASGTLLKERESGVLRRLLVSAIPRASIFWGKFLFTLVVGLVNLAVLFTYGEVVFRIGAFRDPLSLAVVSLVWALTATSFGMLIASWARTTKQAEGLATVVILVMAALGGCWFPLQIMELPKAGELLVRSMPTYWAMTAYQQMLWNGFAWHQPQVLSALGVQLGVAVVALAAALFFFQRRYVAG